MTEQQDQHAHPTEGRSRGPAVHSGGKQEIDAPLPPYEGHRETGKSEEQLIEERSNTDHFAGPREVSEEERKGMSDTDTNPSGPLGVGESTADPGNERMLGEPEEKHRKDREESTHAGVGRSQPIDSDSPNLSPGDQGG